MNRADVPVDFENEVTKPYSRLEPSTCLTCGDKFVRGVGKDVQLCGVCGAYGELIVAEANNHLGEAARELLGAVGFVVLSPFPALLDRAWRTLTGGRV